MTTNQLQIQQNHLENSEYWLNHYRFFLELNSQPEHFDIKEVNYYTNRIQEELAWQARLKEQIQLLEKINVNHLKS